MNCPKCGGVALADQWGAAGILTETCPQCGGLWLDKGQIYQFVKDPKRLHQDLELAYAKPAPGLRPCPRCGEKMAQVKFPPPGPVIDVCRLCGGTWFDAGEVDGVRELLDKELSAERSARPPQAPPSENAPAGVAAAMASGAAAAVAGAVLEPLPSLALRSVAVLGGLYAVLLAFSAALVAYLHLPLDFIYLASAAALVLSFLLSPWFTDLSMTWLHAFRWVDPSDLQPPLRKFINETCQARGIPFPRCGIIEDENPNAFTYGHYPGDARLIITQGILHMLDEREQQSVVAHELGHIVHWDMLVMTLAALVPTILYGVYRTCMRAKRSSSGSKKGSGGVVLIGFTALVLYYVTEYVVLFLSRTRELYADRFSGEVTRDPNSLASALVKIAYGLAGHRSEEAEVESPAAHSTMRVMGIFDPVRADALVASSLTTTAPPSKEDVLGAMQWDLWNPWAKFYELQSTHPLPAHRLELLGEQAASYGQTPYARFDRVQPESYWDDFFLDFVVYLLPLVAAALGGVLAFEAGPPLSRGVLWAALAGWACGQFVKLSYMYRADFYAESTVAALLKKVKVSGVREIPSKLKGKIIGRGIPGYLISEHLVIQDATGFMFLDYQQPLAIFQWAFALTRVPELIGQSVEVSGWYRRAPVPYLEIRRIVSEGKTNTCYSLEGQWVFTLALLGFSLWKLLPSLHGF